MALRAGSLVVAGSFQGDIINPLAKFAVWNGSAWTALTPNPSPPEAADLAADIDPAGADLLFRWTRFNGVSTLGTAGVIRGNFIVRFLNDQPLQQAATPATFGPVGVVLPIVDAAATIGSTAHIFSIGESSLTPLNDDHVVRPYSFSSYGEHVVAFESLEVDPVTQHTLVFQRAGDQWVSLGELDFRVAEAREFQGSLFAMGPGIYPKLHAVRWDGSQWHDVGAGLPYMRPALDVVAGRLLLTGALLSSTGTWIGHPLPKHWDGSGWVEETTSVLGARTTLDSDGSRILALSTVNLTTGALSLFDGSRLTSIGSHPLAGANYAAALLFHGEPFVVFKVPGPQPFNVISRRHAGVWETNRQDTVSTGLFIHRDTLYTDSGLRWDGAAWLPDTAFPAPGKNNVLARLAPTASVNGDLWIAGDLLERSGVVSAGSIASTCGCKADLTGDGVQELDDYFAFFNAWEIAGSLADVNFDGTVDLLDFFFFFENWDIGCGA